MNTPAEESLTVVQEETLQDLLPLPAGMSMPGMLESAPGPAAVFTPAGPQVVAQESSAEQPAPQVALMDPIAAPVPVQRIDLDAAFALQDVAATSAKTVGHHYSNGCETGDCGVSGHEVYCRPRGTVNLPSSTLREYFRSHPCYTNVWDGYGVHCGPHHKHLHGECDCFKHSGHGNCDCHGNCDSCAGR